MTRLRGRRPGRTCLHAMLPSTQSLLHVVLLVSIRAVVLLGLLPLLLLVLQDSTSLEECSPC